MLLLFFKSLGPPAPPPQRHNIDLTATNNRQKTLTATDNRQKGLIAYDRKQKTLTARV